MVHGGVEVGNSEGCQTGVSMCCDEYERLANLERGGREHWMERRLTRIFVMVSRYDLFGDLKAGYQASITVEVMATLQRHFNVEHECFASPLNRSLTSFCSVFWDCDRFFGSSDSFFSWWPETGSYEVNPPFDPITIKNTFIRLKAILDKSDSKDLPLSFVVVVPLNAGAVAVLQDQEPMTKGIRKHVKKIMKTTEAYFQLGMQHKKGAGGGGWKATLPTMVIWLQNTQGNELWNPTAEKCADVMAAFGKEPAARGDGAAAAARAAAKEKEEAESNFGF